MAFESVLCEGSLLKSELITSLTGYHLPALVNPTL